MRFVHGIANSRKSIACNRVVDSCVLQKRSPAYANTFEEQLSTEQEALRTYYDCCGETKFLLAVLRASLVAAFVGLLTDNGVSTHNVCVKCRHCTGESYERNTFNCQQKRGEHIILANTAGGGGSTCPCLHGDFDEPSRWL